MRVGGKYSKDIWFWFLSLLPVLTVGGGDGAWKAGCIIFPTDTPKITLSARVPRLHAAEHTRVLRGPGHEIILMGMVCAWAQHRPSLHQWALASVLSPSLARQRCQINHTLLVWRIQTLPPPPPTSIQGIIPQETPPRLVVLREPHLNLCSSISLD